VEVNYYTDYYQLNFREFFDGGEFNSLFGFQIEIFANFYFYFFLLFDDWFNGNPRIY